MNPSEILELGKQPVRPDAPGGESCRDDADFETIQLEVRRLELPDGGQPDWQKVVNLGGGLLKTRSKDLLVAAWVAVGLFHTAGWAGFDAGLTLLRDMVDVHWDVLFPELKRVKGRVGALEWIVERGTREADRRGGGEKEAVLRCKERLRELSEKVDAKVEGGASFGDLRQAIERAEAASAPPPSAAPTQAAAAAPAASAPAAITGAADVPRALNEARAVMRSVAEYLRANEPTNPLAYRLPRTAAWMHLVAPPPSADGQTQIPAPLPADTGEKIQQMFDAGQHAGVLEQTEARIGTSVFWLDLHRYAVLALEALGPAYQPCAEAIVEEVGLLLRRLPTLKDLRFKEGAPLAAPATQRWLSERVLLGASKDGADAGPTVSRAAQGAGPELEGLDEARSKAQALARQKRLPDAMGVLEEGLARCRSIRGGAYWRLEMARVCQQQNLNEAAFTQLDTLDRDLGRATVDSWDPDLAAEVLKSLFLAHQKVLSSQRPIPPEETQRAREILSRLYRLDVVAALALEQKR